MIFHRCTERGCGRAWLNLGICWLKLPGRGCWKGLYLSRYVASITLFGNDSKHGGS